MFKTKFIIKKIISYILTMTLLLSLMVTPVHAESANAKTYKYEGYTIDYKIKSQWDKNQIIEVKITNTAAEPILNWAIKYNAGGTVKELSSAVVYKQTENDYIIKNAGYNYEIKPNKSVNFNYTLNGTNPIIPDDIELISKEVIKQSGYDVKFQIIDDWGTGYQAKVTIKNLSDIAIEAWKLSFDSNVKINSVWDARILTKGDNTYTVGSQSWTNPIKAGSSVTFGLTGSKKAGVKAEINNLVLKEVCIVEEIDWEDTTDSDKDGLTDVWEINVYQTNPNKADTDGDGLKDGAEIFETNTDPLKTDSDDNGITDDLEDPDKDDLSNIKEIELGTNPKDADSDGDGLSDGEEVNTYKTDALSYDTDNDSIGDGDEIKIGLDPNNPKTFGVPDSEYTFEQNIKAEKLEEINKENLFSTQINITAAGIADESISVSESPYSNSLQNNDAILGKVIEIDYAEKLKVDSATVSFAIPVNNMGNPTGMYDDAGLAGIQRFQVFKYDTKSNLMYPVETKFDMENNTLTATTEELGNYLILDLDKWMYNLGIAPMGTAQPMMSNIELPLEELPEITESNTPDVQESVSENEVPEITQSVSGNEIQEAESSVSGNEIQETDSSVSDNNVQEQIPSVSDNEVQEKMEEAKIPEEVPVDYDEIMQRQIESILGRNALSFASPRAFSALPEYNKQIDLVFAIDTSGSMGGTINTCKQKMASLVSSLYNLGVTTNVSIVSFEDTYSPIKKYYTSDKQLWAKTPAQTQELINQLGRLSGGAENHIDALDVAKSLPYKPNNQKFIVLITDEPIYERDNNCGKSTKTIAEQLKESGIITSVVSERAATFEPVYQETGGIQTSIYGDFHKYLYAFITGYLQNNKTYTYIGANDLCTRTLKAPIVRNGNTDSDEDGLTDWNETDKQAIDQFETGAPVDGAEIYVPTFEQYMLYMNLFDATQFDRINPYYADEIAMLRILPIVSDPMSKDGDEDGVTDKEDKYPLDCTAFDIMHTSLSDSGIGYRFDHSYFFKDNTVYNKELSITSSIFASVVYEDIQLKNRADTSPGNAYIDELMRYHGFNNIVIKKLSDEYSDQHITDVAIGSKKVTYKGETKYIIAIAIRGTNGTIEEWSSNFDIGTSETIYDNENNIVPKNADWKNSQNHMGFDIAATRVTKVINDYISTNCDANTAKTLWITGHSRGAGIANIVGANLSDKYKSYVYTFACPNTTTASNPGRFKNIFNIVNADDIITQLPLSNWDFSKYGVTKALSIGDNYKNDWKELTGEKYKYNTEDKNNLLNKFFGLANTRDNCYIYTCKCHGDGSDDGIIVNISKKDDGSPDIVNYGKDYCKVVSEKNKYRTCQTTSYFMQYLAQVATDTPKIFINVPDKYEGVKLKFAIYVGFGNMHSPHYQESYYLLSRRS